MDKDGFNIDLSVSSSSNALDISGPEVRVRSRFVVFKYKYKRGKEILQVTVQHDSFIFLIQCPAVSFLG